MEASALYRLAYVSQACTGAGRAPQLRDILATSRARNRLAGITGAMTFGSGTFGQVLEGPSGALEATFERIERDPRHRDVVLLDLAPIPVRSFGVWPLALVAPGIPSRLDEVAEPCGFTAAVRCGERLHVLLCERLRARRPAIGRAARLRSPAPDNAFGSGS